MTGEFSLRRTDFGVGSGEWSTGDSIGLEVRLAFDIPLSHVQTAIKRGNQEIGASVVEMAEAEYMVRATGYLRNEQDLANIPLGVNSNGTPLRLKDVADIGLGPQMRRGIAELNGEGEAVGGIVVMRRSTLGAAPPPACGLSWNISPPQMVWTMSKPMTKISARRSPPTTL